MLSIEEKARRYDEAINEIKNLRDMLLKEGVINKEGIICYNFNKIFPEKIYIPTVLEANTVRYKEEGSIEEYEFNDSSTITEDYVSFEIARLLKEKGFDAKCDKCYAYFADDDIRFLNLKYPKSAQLLIENRYPCITLQMAMKWLREKHNIVVEPFIQEDTKYVWYIHRIETRFNKKYLIFCWGSKNDKYERYEQACEAAIKYCLDLI